MDDFQFLYGNKTKADESARAAVNIFGGEIGEYKDLGEWDASTNTPAIADGNGEYGNYYIVSVAGSQDLGSGLIAFNVDDQVMYYSDTESWKIVTTS